MIIAVIALAVVALVIGCRFRIKDLPDIDGDVDML